MATQLESNCNSTPDLAEEMRYVARQPILDQRGRVHGYEFLFRGDRDTASRALLDATVLFGLERYSNGLPAFVTCTAETLTDGLVQVLPPSLTVLVIPAAVEPAPELIEAALALKAQGFRLALEDFVPSRRLQRLVERADYLVMEFNPETARRCHQAFQLSPASIARIARRVETQDTYELARAAGFTLFQGSYFCRPMLLKNRKVPANRFFHFELLRQLNREYIDLRKVAELVLRDAPLTYRLLRIVNSPYCAMQQEVRSIESALLLLGEEAFRRIATLAILSECNADQPPEILQMALLRARFCALAAETCTLNPAEQYLLGVLSLLPAMLGVPMEAITPTLPLRRPVCDALEGTPTPERCLLTWLESHERGDWSDCDLIVRAHDLDIRRLIHCYADAVLWAQATLRATA